jgi:site-specific recombinase XerD
MKNKNTFGVHFLLRKSRPVDGKFPVYARVCVNKSRVEMSIKKSLAPSDWDEGKGAAKQNKKQLKEFNTELEEIRASFVSVYLELVREKADINAEMVKNKFLQIGSFAPPPKEAIKTLRWLITEHNTLMQSVLRWGSMKNYHTTERYLHKFLELKYQDGDIPLTDLNYSFISGFEFYVRSTPLKKNDPCTNNGTMKHLERLKKMATWAWKNEWVEKDPFFNFSLKFKYPTIKYLEAGELATIENKHLIDPKLSLVRDLFVFCCYTALSYTDLMQLTEDRIGQGIGGFQWIKGNRQKTDNAFDVPLLAKPLELLKKYKPSKGDMLNRVNCFPYSSNQEVNRGLKLIAEICGISKVMTFHLARHTFATTVCLANGVSMPSISKMMGHSKISTTEIYAHVLNVKICEDMQALQSKLEQQPNPNQMIAV